MISQPTWRQRDGRTIPIREMSNEHLVNSIGLLRERSLGQNPADTFPNYQDLVGEAMKRGLIKDQTLAERGIELVRRWNWPLAFTVSVICLTCAFIVWCFTHLR